MVTAVALTFRFAELVAFIGGTEQTTGEIVQAGMLGALASRLFLGQLLDRYGIRVVWAGNALLFALGCFAFMFCREVSWLIFAARIIFAIGVAGMSTAAVLFVQNQVSRDRRTEVIGNFGSSGFLGMVIGSQAGDFIFAQSAGSAVGFYFLFGLASIFAIAYLVLALFITRSCRHNRPAETPGFLKLVVTYWPGPILLAGLMIGVSLTVTTVFLTRMTTERGLGGIGTFFLGYCTSAFFFRVASSRWVPRLGNRNLVLLGLAGHGCGHLVLSVAMSQWHLIPAAVICGFGHALLFPSVVSLGAGTFPREYRGTGTTLALGFTELGMAISAPTLGWIIDTSRAAGLTDPFAPMYYASAGAAATIGLVYFVATRKAGDPTASRPRAETVKPAPVETAPAHADLRSHEQTDVTA